MKGTVSELSLFENMEDVSAGIRQASIKRKKVAESFAAVLTSRDFEVLRFILEMKFASSAEVFEKFFRFTRETSEARSDAWAKKRLLQLERAGFLRSTYTFSESTKYFVATFRAYYALGNFYPKDTLPKPIAGLDLRTFHHDKSLLQIRIRLERDKQVSRWISERRLKAGIDRAFGFTSKYVPDAVYTTLSGEQIALELEIAQKAKTRYRDKIKFYVGLLRSARTNETRLRQVRFLCVREQPFEILSSEARIFGGIFSVELLGSAK